MDPEPFPVETFFPRSLFDRICKVRISQPEIVEARAKQRIRPSSLTQDSGNVVILAADHPARGVTSAARDPFAMGDRQSYLGRIVRVLSSPFCDGILGTPDIIEDLLIVDHLMIEAGIPSILDNRILAGTMNRGGLVGACFEMDDTFTAYTANQIVNAGLDAAKMMFRFDEQNPDSVRTLTACARALDECVDLSIPVYLEALPVEQNETGYRVIKTPEALIRTVGIASGIGKSSLYTWIKIPYCDRYDDVARATSCPILMLGGESSGDPARIYQEFASGMTSAGNVRGALVGRNVHHPGVADPAAVAAAVYGVVHEAATPDRAIETMSARHLENIGLLEGVG